MRLVAQPWIETRDARIDLAYVGLDQPGPSLHIWKMLTPEMFRGFGDLGTEARVLELLGAEATNPWLNEVTIQPALQLNHMPVAAG